MEHKALPGHAMSKDRKQSNARDSTVCDDLQTHSVQLSKDGIVFAFWSFCEKIMKKQVVIRKRMKNVRIYLHTP